MSDEWKDYAHALVASFDHSRFVLILMTIGSVVAFVAYWTAARDENWLASQARVGQAVLAWWDCPPKCPQTPEEVRRFVQARLFGYNVAGLFHYDSTEKKDFQEVQASFRNVANQATWLVKTPLFENSVSINDLGLLAGIALTALLFWYSLSLRRIESGLQFALDLSDPASLRTCFKFLSMQQLAPLPSTEGDLHNTRRTALHVLSELGLASPFVVLALIDLHDYKTRSIGRLISETLTATSLKFEVATLALVFLLTVMCAVLAFRIASVWHRKARAVLDP